MSNAYIDTTLGLYVVFYRSTRIELTKRQYFRLQEQYLEEVPYVEVCIQTRTKLPLMIFDKCQCCQEFSVDETCSTDFLLLLIKAQEELFSPQEKPITVKLAILLVRKDRNHFFYPNIWSISYQTNLQNIARNKCFEIIPRVDFTLHYGKKNVLPPNYRTIT